MIQKFILCILTCTLTVYPTDDDLSVTRSKFYNNVTTGAKRALVSVPFDFVTIVRQVTGSPYREIPSHFVKTSKKLSHILSAHFIETALRAEMIYNLYPYTVSNTSNFFPEASLQNSIIPQIIAAATISMTDILCANPFERIKVCYINSLPLPFEQNGKISFSDIPKHRKWLFTGGTVTFLSSFTHIGTFLSLNYFNKKYLFEHEGPLTFREACLSGPIIAIAQATISYPFLTFRAKLHADQIKRAYFSGTGISPIQHFMTLVQNNTAYSLYYGWRARIIRGTVMAILDAYWINKTNI